MNDINRNFNYIEIDGYIYFHPTIWNRKKGELAFDFKMQLNKYDEIYFELIDQPTNKTLIKRLYETRVMLERVGEPNPRLLRLLA